MTNLEIKHIVERLIDPNKDSITIGTPGRFGEFKVYGDTNNPEEFIRKVDAALAILKYTNDALEVIKTTNVKLIDQPDTTNVGNHHV